MSPGGPGTAGEADTEPGSDRTAIGAVPGTPDLLPWRGARRPGSNPAPAAGSSGPTAARGRRHPKRESKEGDKRNLRYQAMASQPAMSCDQMKGGEQGARHGITQVDVAGRRHPWPDLVREVEAG